MPTRKPHFGLVAMCDAVYQDEKSKKAVLAGLFLGDVLVESMPASVGVAFFLEVIGLEHGHHDIDVRFYVDKEAIGGAKVEFEASSGDEPGALVMPPIRIRVQKELRLRMRASIDGGKETTILDRAIRLKATEPTLFAQPFEQSPTSAPA